MPSVWVVVMAINQKESLTMTSPQVTQAVNGVDVVTLFATRNAVKDQPELADFQFRARNEWVSATHMPPSDGGAENLRSSSRRSHCWATEYFADAARKTALRAAA